MENTALIAGLEYVPDFISKKEEKQLLEKIAQGTWEDLYVRRIQQYGCRYHFIKRTIDHVSTHTTLPVWALPLAQAFAQAEYLTQIPDLLIVNEYKIGEGIAPHVDSPLLFGETIVIVSLGADCVMEFEPLAQASSTQKLALPLAARSLLVMQGEARHHWNHSIVNVLERRLSLTFRTVKERYRR